MKKMFMSLALVSGLILTSSFTTAKKEDAIFKKDPVAYTVIEYTKNGQKLTIIVHSVLDCDNITNLGNVDSIDRCWHF